MNPNATYRFTKEQCKRQPPPQLEGVRLGFCSQEVFGVRMRDLGDGSYWATEESCLEEVPADE